MYLYDPTTVCVLLCAVLPRPGEDFLFSEINWTLFAATVSFQLPRPRIPRNPSACENDFSRLDAHLMVQLLGLELNN